MIMMMMISSEKQSSEKQSPIRSQISGELRGARKKHV
jgi:hypothetical protein